LLILWCREGGSNPHDRKGRLILSPQRKSCTTELEMADRDNGLASHFAKHPESY